MAIRSIGTNDNPFTFQSLLQHEFHRTGETKKPVSKPIYIRQRRLSAYLTLRTRRNAATFVSAEDAVIRGPPPPNTRMQLTPPPVVIEQGSGSMSCR
jgi:hypothetical protein